MTNRGEKAAGLYQETERKLSGEFWYHRGIKAYDVDPNLPYPVTVLPEAIHTTPVETLALIALRGTPRVTDFLNHIPNTFDPSFDPSNTDLRWCSHCSNARGWLHASAFGIDSSRSTGDKIRYKRYCKSCCAEMEQIRRDTRRAWGNGFKPSKAAGVVPISRQVLTQ